MAEFDVTLLCKLSSEIIVARQLLRFRDEFVV